MAALLAEDPSHLSPSAYPFHTLIFSEARLWVREGYLRDFRSCLTSERGSRAKQISSVAHDV